jgi:hypothetical protein
MSLKDLPATHLKVAIEELNARFKVCISLAMFVEEVAEIESSTGKQLVKVFYNLVCFYLIMLVLCCVVFSLVFRWGHNHLCLAPTIGCQHVVLLWKTYLR